MSNDILSDTLDKIFEAGLDDRLRTAAIERLKAALEELPPSEQLPQPHALSIRHPDTNGKNHTWPLERAITTSILRVALEDALEHFQSGGTVKLDVLHDLYVMDVHEHSVSSPDESLIEQYVKIAGPKAYGGVFSIIEGAFHGVKS